MRALNILCIAALTALSAPAWAALTFTGAGAYNLGSSSSSGTTAAPTSGCGLNNGQDALAFEGSGDNNVGIHAYSCQYDSGIDFGSRASGENTFYARGIASVVGTMATADSQSFSFFILPGEVGAFGNAAFVAGEFQKAKMTIKLVIDGVSYLDEAWSAEVGTGGAITSSHTSNADPSSGLNIGFSEASGAGYFSYGLSGGFYNVALGDGVHDISYVMTSESSGSIFSTVSCTAVLYGNTGQETAARDASANVVAAGPNAGAPFSSYCGAGARSGDPFNDPIARAYFSDDQPIPEPMTAGLAVTALLAAAGARRRNSKR